MCSKPSQGIRVAAVVALLLFACAKKEPLTAKKAEEIVRGRLFTSEPVYAEVPQKVWWDAKSPKDAYDEKALRTLQNLERAGLVTIGETYVDGTTTYLARVTKKGFPILGTTPSARGPAFRGKICEKKYDGLRDFVRHPTIPTVGHAVLVWHYENPTWLYPLFETKINKPLNHPFVSEISFHYEKFEWRFEVVVPKEER